MDDSKKPRLDLAKKTLPHGLLSALESIFVQGCGETMLVGGTALSGFYAGHRRSDDIDLFCKDADSFSATVLAVKALSKNGATLTSEFRSANYYKTTVQYLEHTFTIDTVLDSNCFRVGIAHDIPIPNREFPLKVASLVTILKLKCATLVSRASEKVLYDLLWLFDQFPELQIAELLTLGSQIDGGVTGEGVIFTLGSTKPKESACGFSIDFGISASSVYEKIELFREELLKTISQILHKKRATGTLAEIVASVKKLRP